VLPSFSFSSIDSPVRPSSGRSLYIGGEISGLGGNVRSLRPVVEFKMFRPLTRSAEGEHPHVLGFRLQGSFLTGYGGLVAPPFERFYQGGDTDLRGFDIRSVSPVAFMVQNVAIPLLNPDGTAVPKDPTNPRRGSISVPVPVRRIVFPGGDTSAVANLEYRIPIVGPVTLAPFVDFGLNFIARNSQLRVSDAAFNDLNSATFGCSGLDVNFNCVGSLTGLTFERNLEVVSGTNFVPRMSTGLEVQVLLPILNAPFRVYWAYNPLLLNTIASTPNQCGAAQCITRELFPPGAAGDFTYLQTLRAFAPDFRLKEPRKTFRFTVSTTF
jgi:outer membrane protein insertion porin family